MVVAGVWCIFSADVTYLTLIWLFGLCIIFDAAGGISAWSDRRRIGLANGWDLAAAIISIVFGVFLVCSNGLRFLAGYTLLYVCAVWLIIVGVIRIIAAARLRRFRLSLGLGLSGSRWGRVLIFGILMVLAGILCIIHPGVLATAFGAMVGIAIAFSGFALISFAVLI